MGKSFLVSALILVSAAIMESAILSNIYILPVVPDLVLICSVYLSLLNGRTYGELSGFVSGLSLDFLTGGPFGFNCIFRTIIGYVYGFFSETINISLVIVPILTVSTGTALKHLLIWVTSFFYTHTINPTNFLSIEFMFELVANTVLAPFMFKFLGCFFKTLAIHLDKEIPDDA